MLTSAVASLTLISNPYQACTLLQPLGTTFTFLKFVYFAPHDAFAHAPVCYFYAATDLCWMHFMPCSLHTCCWLLSFTCLYVSVDYRFHMD